MYNRSLCLATGDQFTLTIPEQIELFGQVGFEGFFTAYDENIASYREIAERAGMIYQSVHAPHRNAARMWTGGEEGEHAVAELIGCAEKCGEAGVGIMVCHTYIGFGKHCEISNTGIDNFRRVVEYAARRGVKIAFENTEGEEFLGALLTDLAEYDNVGYCWDSGHEQCYNYGVDLLGLYGNRLIATHLNDNCGIKDRTGKITWTDDLHLLPFDGIIDWDEAAKKLCKCSYNGILTFELNKKSKPGRHENDKYERMSDEEYVTEAYIRACRFAKLVKKHGA